MKEETKCYCGHTTTCDCGPEETKQETLEEAAENYSLELLEAKTIQPHEKTWIKSMFIHIAKWQEERSYSEEEVKEILKLRESYTYGVDKNDWFSVDHWFEQFKKK